MLGHYFFIWLQRQECLDITSLFGYRVKSAWTLLLYSVTEAIVPDYRGKSAWLQRQERLDNRPTSLFGYRGISAWTLLLYLVTEARVPGHYFSIWLQRQVCLDITSLFGYRGKSAWTSLLYLDTKARVPGHYFSVWLQRQECLDITSVWLQRQVCLVKAQFNSMQGTKDSSLLAKTI